MLGGQPSPLAPDRIAPDRPLSRNLITAAVALTMGAGNLSITAGDFTLGGIGTATFGAIILYQILSRGRSGGPDEPGEAAATPSPNPAPALAAEHATTPPETAATAGTESPGPVA